jgi:hypothetical protein
MTNKTTMGFLLLVLLLWLFSRRSSAAAVSVGLTITQPDFEDLTVGDETGQGPRWSAWPQANGARN